MNTRKNSTKGGESGQSVGLWTKIRNKLFGEQTTKWELYIENENGKFWTHPETPLAVHETEDKAAVVCGKYVLEYYKTEATTKQIKQATQQIIQQMVEDKGRGAREDMKAYNEAARIKIDATLKAQGLDIYGDAVKNQVFQTALGIIKMTPH